MATKASIITEINQKIVANGNIRAVNTNKILRDILNCDELNTQNTLQEVQFTGTTNSGIAKISYSIKGFEGLFANITLDINIKESNTSNFTVPYSEEKLTAFLDSIIKNQNNKVDFLVKIRNQNTKGIYKNLGVPQKVFRIGNLNFGYNSSNNKNVLQISIESQELNDNLVSEDTIVTSFAIHNI